MSDQLYLLRAEPPAGPQGVGDPLDRFYTPDLLAAACVSAILPGVRTDVHTIIEPSRGGGAFCRAIDATRLSAAAHRYAVDLDSSAPEPPGWACVTGADFIGWEPERVDPGRTLLVGNPPFGVAFDHVRHARTIAGHVVMILPLAWLGTMQWRELHPDVLHPIIGRPWGAHMREVALWEWHPTRRGLRGPISCGRTSWE